MVWLEFSDFHKHRDKQINSSSPFILWLVKHHTVCGKLSTLCIWHQCGKYQPMYRKKNKCWTERPNHLHKVCPKILYPKGMRLQRPWPSVCFSPSNSETFFSTNCDKFWSCFTWSPCYFYFFSLSRINQNFQSLTKKEKGKKRKLAAQQSSKPFSILLIIAAQ